MIAIYGCAAQFDARDDSNLRRGKDGRRNVQGIAFPLPFAVRKASEIVSVLFPAEKSRR